MKKNIILTLVAVFFIWLASLLFNPVRIGSNNILFQWFLQNRYGLSVKEGNFVCLPLSHISGENFFFITKQGVCVKGKEMILFFPSRINLDFAIAKSTPKGSQVYQQLEARDLFVSYNQNSQSVPYRFLKQVFGVKELHIKQVWIEFLFSRDLFSLKQFKCFAEDMYLMGYGGRKRDQLNYRFALVCPFERLNLLLGGFGNVFEVEKNKSIKIKIYFSGDRKKPHIRLWSRYFDLRFRL